MGANLPPETAVAEIVNLRMVRKRKAREQAERDAAANRAKFGRTPAQKARDEAETETARHKLDQLRRDPPAED